MNITADTRVSDLTADEFSYFIKDIIKQELRFQQGIELVHGIDGLTDFLGWGYTKTQESVAKGFFDDALYKNGRNYSFDKKKVLEILKVEPRRKVRKSRYRR